MIAHWTHSNLLEGGGKLATKSLAKLLKNSLKIFAFVLSSKFIFSSFSRQMFETEPFLEGKPKDFRAFHNCFSLPVFLLIFFFLMFLVFFY